MSTKDICDKLNEFLASLLIEKDYNLYKEKKFIKIVDDVIMYVELVCLKQDVCVWFASYPIFQNDLNFGSAAITERFPDEEGRLTIDSDSSIVQIEASLIEGVKKIFKFHEERSSIELLGKSIPNSSKVFPLMVKGVCLSVQGKINEAMPFLNSLVETGLNFGESRKGAMQLIESFKDGSTKELLENNKKNNVKKLRLAKFVKI